MCSRSSGVNFRDTNTYVESSLCIFLPKVSSLVSHGCAIIARIGCAQPFAGLRIDSDGVYKAHVFAPLRFVAEARCFLPRPLHFMPASSQRLLHALWKLAFHANAIRHPLMMESWRIDGCLRFHTQLHPIDHA